MGIIQFLVEVSTPLAKLSQNVLSIGALLFIPGFIIYTYSKRAWKRGKVYRRFVDVYKDNVYSAREDTPSEFFIVDEGLYNEDGVNSGDYAVGRTKIHVTEQDHNFVLNRRFASKMRVPYTSKQKTSEFPVVSPTDVNMPPRSIQEVMLRQVTSWLEKSNKVGSSRIYRIDAVELKGDAAINPVSFVYCIRPFKSSKLHYIYFDDTETVLVVKKNRKCRIISGEMVLKDAEKRVNNVTNAIFGD